MKTANLDYMIEVDRVQGVGPVYPPLINLAWKTREPSVERRVVVLWPHFQISLSPVYKV